MKQYKKIKILKKDGKLLISADGEEYTPYKFHLAEPMLGYNKLRQLVKSRKASALKRYINDGLYKHHRGVYQNREVYRFSDGRRFLLEDIEKAAGITKATASVRVKKWKEKGLPDSWLLEDKHQGTSSSDSKLGELSGKSRVKLASIPRPTLLERKYCL